jgi:uncharacterized metal-binding protein
MIVPDGKTHFKIWKRWRPIPLAAALILLVVFQDYALATGLVVGYALGRYVDPDLDQIGITNAEARTMQDFKILGAVVVAIWLPYAYVMRFVGIGRRGHRNFFSHFPGVGTAIRLAYMLALPALVIWYYGLPVGGFVWIALAGVLIGLTWADALHWFADITEKKSRRRRY